MLLKEYLAKIDNLVKEYPDALEYEVIYSVDDDGNEYNTVNFDPSVGVYDVIKRDFYTVELNKKGDYIQAICIN